jgi:hypothetical protein
MQKQRHPVSPSVSPPSSSGSGNPHGSAADPGSDPPPYRLSNRGTLLGVVLTLGLTVIVTAYVLLQSPPRPPEDPRWHMPDVDPALGRLAIITHGCGGCHVIPGVPGATGRVGPQLTQFHAQTYIAGVLPNLPENLALWIRDPRSINPVTAMPTLPITPAESRHIAAYLYSLP